jgi:membrane-associated phospholipid phosphatase
MAPRDLTTGLTRRAALGVGTAGALMAALGHAPRSAWAAAASTRAAGIEQGAGGWSTWILDSASELRPPAPPDRGAARLELEALRAMTSERDAAALDQVSYWDSAAPGHRWNEIAIAQGLKDGIAIGAYRVLALVHVAIYDATVAAWDAKYSYNRPRPSEADPSLTTVVPNPSSPSYPSEHAAAAGAASTVLAYLFPNDAQFFMEKAEMAGQSRLIAGVQYPSDVEAGLELGRAVAARVIDRARVDGADAKWTGTMPAGPGIWFGEPLLPGMGNWKTWVLESGSELRPGPPPAFDSAERAAELAEVKSYQRDANPFSELFFWPEDPAGRPAPGAAPVSSNQIVFYYAPLLHLLWTPELNQKLAEYRLDSNPPRAARAYALVSVAAYDATVASWEAKYFYWTARPNQFDPTIKTVVPTYPIPDYPSGHASTGGAMWAMLAYLFPRDANLFNSRADENAASRMWAGIHFRSACESGLALGRAVAGKVIQYAMSDGA